MCNLSVKTKKLFKTIDNTQQSLVKVVIVYSSVVLLIEAIGLVSSQATVFIHCETYTFLTISILGT